MALQARSCYVAIVVGVTVCLLLLVIGKASRSSVTELQHAPQLHVTEQRPQREVASGIASSLVATTIDTTTAAACGSDPARNLTIVTAFVNIGPFAKGTQSNVRSPDLYRNWMRAFSQVRNPVVAFFDDPSIAKSFKSIRAGLPTKIVPTSQLDGRLWSFSLRGRVQAVLDQPGYPANPPQTTSAAYVCAMHAKYDFVEAAASENHFGTRHFAWMDVGLFREHADKDSPQFLLQVPLCYRDGAVAFSQVYEMTRVSVSIIMRDSVDWVSGAFFVADVDAMVAFARDYRRHAEALLSRSLVSHDQSVIMAMYSPESAAEGLPAPVVPLQAFIPDSFDPWFYIPYVQRQEWLQWQNCTTRLSSPVTCSSKIYT